MLSFWRLGVALVYKSIPPLLPIIRYRYSTTYNTTIFPTRHTVPDSTSALSSLTAHTSGER
jgi:hypothetical protein